MSTSSQQEPPRPPAAGGDAADAPPAAAPPPPRKKIKENPQEVAPQPPRYAKLQSGRTLVGHPTLDQDEHHQRRRLEMRKKAGGGGLPNHVFIVCADTQLGMTSGNAEWETELEYSRLAVKLINSMMDNEAKAPEERPLFCCMCGDLVDMTAGIFENKPKQAAPAERWTRQECDDVQARQNADFKEVWNDLHEDLPLVCMCGNHDVGNRPNAASIERYTSEFGDDYLSFWANGSYNIVLNTSLFSDPSDAVELYDRQLEWIQDRLQYANDNGATHIFVFGHHAWFLYDENETPESMDGKSPIPPPADFLPPIADSYFHIPIERRKPMLDLFRRHGVTACFAGHFHQNMTSKTSWGMPMITTGPLSVVLESTGIPKDFTEPKKRGIRIVRVVNESDGGGGDEEKKKKSGTFEHEFMAL